VVEVAHDARIREAVQLSFGRVLHPEEVAADKTLALFGRAAARDLVDVAARLSGTHWSSCVSWPPKRTPVSTAVFSPMR
jgi:predicted nucleotidyltransferase component of viral defense system